eukprot:1155252-Pelagomonas_calceolata.AAC.2
MGIFGRDIKPRICKNHKRNADEHLMRVCKLFCVPAELTHPKGKQHSHFSHYVQIDDETEYDETMIQPRKPVLSSLQTREKNRKEHKSSIQTASQCGWGRKGEVSSLQNCMKSGIKYKYSTQTASRCGRRKK